MLSAQIGSSVGYSVKMSSKLPSVMGGSITFMTGMKLAMKFSESPLHGISHVVLDEVHIRDVGTDLVMVKQFYFSHSYVSCATMKFVCFQLVFFPPSFLDSAEAGNEGQ